MRLNNNFIAGTLAPLLLLLLLFSCVSGLYEDQIKKFDWRELHIGAHAQSFVNLNDFVPRLVLRTQENVLASLCPKTGALLWRQILENTPRGDIKLMHISGIGESDTSTTAAARANSNHGFDLLTVQGHAPALVRGWNTNTGTIEWEWTLLPLQIVRAEQAFWFYSNSLLYHVIPVWRSHLEVTQYFATTGSSTGATSKISATWIQPNSCIQSGVYYSCVDGKQLISLDLTANQPQVLAVPLAEELQTQLGTVQGLSGVVVVNKQLVSVRKDVRTCSDLRSNRYVLGNFHHRRVIAYANVVNHMLQIEANYADNCEPVPELKQSLTLHEQYGVPTLSSFDCRAKRSGDGKSCLFVLDTTSESILAVQQNKLRWTREEALANIISTEFIDLPLADSEGALENEMRGKTGDVLSALLRRFSTQALHVKSLFLHVIGLGPPPTDTQRAGIVRDSFGLHKMLVVLTKCGKIFGIDNINGKQHWQRFLPNVANFENNQQMRFIVQRTSKHFPLQPLCTIVARNSETGNGILYRFNPITGQPAEGGLLTLDYKIKQLSLLPETENDFIKGILILDAQHGIHVYPEQTKEMAHGLYIYTADIKTSELNGYFIKSNSGQLTALPIWNVLLGGHNGDQQIIAVAAKNPLERVHSQGRVLGDRSVLYKYINPNLVAFVTQASDNIHKSLLNLYLVDVVSGSVIFSMTHRKVRPPLHIVHSENWLAYSYYNDKVRRTEITTIELYEGKTQANSSIWSSLNAPPMPLIERQSYIVPTIVETLRETITERGITNKHVLIGTASGAIVEMPWAFLDPRRPISSTSQGREEGAIPYIPELPLPPENIINYNQTIARLSNIYTAPSGLESTCLVVATGLDLFVTRVAPSKTFDLLKEDFDYILISVVLVVLTTGSLLARHLASRKLLKQAWK